MESGASPEADGATPPGRVLVADDHPLFRQALVMVFARLSPDLTIEEHGTLLSAGKALAASPAARLLVLDLTLPDTQGFEGLMQMKRRFPRLPVAIVSANEDPSIVRGALASGAIGFIPKSASLATLSEALRMILAGERWMPSGLDGQAAPDESMTTAPLSAAQARVLSGLQRGLMNKQIAYELGVTEATVKAHLTGLFRRLGAHNRTHALLLARGRFGDHSE